MNEDVLAAFIMQTFLPFVPIIAGFVVAITIITILIVMHSWVFDDPSQE